MRSSRLTGLRRCPSHPASLVRARSASSPPSGSYVFGPAGFDRFAESDVVGDEHPSRVAAVDLVADPELVRGAGAMESANGRRLPRRRGGPSRNSKAAGRKPRSPSSSRHRRQVVGTASPRGCHRVGGEADPRAAPFLDPEPRADGARLIGRKAHRPRPPYRLPDRAAGGRSDPASVRRRLPPGLLAGVVAASGV